jgi:hypothetical protein
MQAVGIMRVFYPHLNRITNRVKLGVLPPIVDRCSDWMRAETADAFLSAVRVPSEDGEKELLVMHISRLLDVPVWSDQDESNNIFYITLAHDPALHCARLSHAPYHMNMRHPCAMFLAVQALWDAGMLTPDLMTHIYCVVSPTCDKAPAKWYNILTTFLDDLRRTLSVSAILMNEEGLAKHTNVVSRPVCCLEHTYYMVEGDWIKEEEDTVLGNKSVLSVVSAHQHSGAGGEHRYINEQAALEVAATVFRHGQNTSS